MELALCHCKHRYLHIYICRSRPVCRYGTKCLPAHHQHLWLVLLEQATRKCTQSTGGTHQLQTNYYPVAHCRAGYACFWFFAGMSSVLHYQPAAFPYLDSFCTVISLTAQVFMARKVLENWLIWIFVDIIYVGIYIIKGLEPTAFMFGVYTILAAVGYFDWRKVYREQLKSGII
jgi:nicotinamide mononucleotide transporter PnuC